MSFIPNKCCLYQINVVCAKIKVVCANSIEKNSTLCYKENGGQRCMKINALKCDSVNDMLAKKYLTAAQKTKDYTPLECDKIVYVLKVLLGEFEKLFCIFLVFALQGNLRCFCFCYLIVLTVRQFMGGTHQKTFWGCFFFSLVFFQGTVMLSKYVVLPFYTIRFALLYGIYVGCILRYAPLPSAQKPRCAESKRKHYKLYSVLVLSLWMMLVMLWRDSYYGNGIWWTLLLQLLEILRVEGGKRL